MAEKKQRPRFIRKNGRIIPIGVKKKSPGRSAGKTPRVQTKKKTKAAGEVVAGAGAAAAAGVVSGKQFRKFIAQSDATSTFTQFAREAEMGSPRQQGFLKKAGSTLKKAKRARFIGRAAGIGGALLGGALIGSGLKQFSSNQTGFDADLISSTGSLAASAAITAGTRKGLGRNAKAIMELTKQRFGLKK